MDIEDELEAFRKQLMHAAYQGFLDWACKKHELLQQFYECTGRGAAENMSEYIKWVTETYWGEL